MENYKIVIVLLFISLNVSFTFSQTKNSNIENAIEYFHQRNEAISLVKNEQWQEAVLKLENLIGQYQNDADLYYLLGVSYFQVAQYQNSLRNYLGMTIKKISRGMMLGLEMLDI